MIVFPTVYATHVEADGEDVIISQLDMYGEKYSIVVPTTHVDVLIRCLRAVKAEAKQ